MQWLAELRTTYVNGQIFEVYNPGGTFGALIDGKRYVVPHMMRTDFASIPWFFRRVLERTGQRWCPYGPAAVMHDGWYRGVIPRPGDGGRLAADEYFRRLMLVPYRGAVTPGPIARIMYWAVRIGGINGWHQEGDH